MIEIKRVDSRDLRLFDDVADDVFDETIDPVRLKTYLASSSHHMVVALNDGQIVGQCAAVIHHHPDKQTELYIDEVGTAPSFQRQGIARRMLEEMFVIGKEQGCEEVWVGTEPDNEAARKLYETREGLAGPAETFVMYVYKL
ncbi:GNAT family N-acetyltransferase [Mesorhizobium sp. SB112]|uniref:GNAT family N-acetyltransferase n=1 Tax=Mesorhizobium sp. SB112 TaxID=3151853 RepID=UPI00326714E6